MNSPVIVTHLKDRDLSACGEPWAEVADPDGYENTPRQLCGLCARASFGRTISVTDPALVELVRATSRYGGDDHLEYCWAAAGEDSPFYAPCHCGHRQLAGALAAVRALGVDA